LIFFSDKNTYGVFIVDFQEDKYYIEQINYIDHLKYESTYHFSMDIMAFTETKIIILSQKFHGRQLL
jgi:hypothetical protein